MSKLVPEPAPWPARVRAVLDGSGLNQVDFAKDMGISTSTLNSWLKGSPPSIPGGENLQKMVGKYKCSPTFLLTGLGEPYARGDLKSRVMEREQEYGNEEVRLSSGVVISVSKHDEPKEGELGLVKHAQGVAYGRVFSSGDYITVDGRRRNRGEAGVPIPLRREQITSMRKVLAVWYKQ